ncbi:DUF4351 domain-containing protein [Synechococcus sp. PCC 6312]|uniref:DUF4351 domain-containing protein n=1 Tax=Synechococcus sp. (strain ATCC 27167 / PCC 6312) TaxID=195253 RepID=UPI00029F2415|nr:DUF4351 domain-containing protein [Synechococcus sp. PCC 6312]AFY60679.1 hypothetical protein Syn6312_1516 [Synechococcus sp. PCC 6312]
MGEFDGVDPLWEPLKTELAVEPIRADSIIILQRANTLLHLEFQTLPQSQPDLPFRMVDYYIRLKRLYPESQIVQVLIFLKPTNDPRCQITTYQDPQLSHQYQVVRMWEQEPSPFLQNPGLLPFATLCQTSNPRQLLEQVATKLNQVPTPSGRAQLMACCDVLAGLRFEKDLIHAIFREEIMQESVTYQDILQKGVTQGIKQGVQQGLQQGEVAVVVRLLYRRFGELSPELMTKVRALSVTELEALADALLDFPDLAAFQAWLG